LQGNKELWSAMQEQQVILNKPDISEEDGYRIAELESIISENGGYEAESVAEGILHGLGISVKRSKEPLSALSGGYKIRVLLAQCLFGNPDILLLDEPTNHLDILSIQWLESFLMKKFKNIVILISHDHDF
jgi:ATPase subunit of ABC transporter with duplicated ATPase domains